VVVVGSIRGGGRYVEKACNAKGGHHRVPTDASPIAHRYVQQLSKADPRWTRTRPRTQTLCQTTKGVAASFAGGKPGRRTGWAEAWDFDPASEVSAIRSQLLKRGQGPCGGPRGGPAFHGLGKNLCRGGLKRKGVPHGLEGRVRWDTLRLAHNTTGPAGMVIDQDSRCVTSRP